jgi:hypothetical protein
VSASSLRSLSTSHDTIDDDEGEGEKGGEGVRGAGVLLGSSTTSTGVAGVLEASSRGVLRPLQLDKEPNSSSSHSRAREVEGRERASSAI